MTELEKLASLTASRSGHPTAYAIILDALEKAYNLGRALTPAQLAARKRNAQKAGRKAGSRDSHPRVRRTRAQIEEAKAKEVKS